MKLISVDAKVTANCDTLIVTGDVERLENIRRVIVDNADNGKVFHESWYDRVSVVRCKDCKYADESTCEKDKYEYLCKKYNIYIYDYNTVYCPYGERRNNETDETN